MSKHSTEFKIKVVNKYLESKGSSIYLSDKYGIPSNNINKIWANVYK